MNQMQQFAAKQALQGAMGNITNNFKPKQETEKEINWEDFNYPPYLKLIHYDPEELTNEQKVMTGLQRRNKLIFLFLCFLNVINNLYQFFQDSKNAHRLINSCLIIIIINPLQLALFYRLLLGVAKDKSYLKLFKISQMIAMLFYFIFSCWGAGSFNGFYRANILFNENPKMVVPGILCIVESFLYWIMIILSAVVVGRVIQFQDKENLIGINNNQKSNNNLQTDA